MAEILVRLSEPAPGHNPKTEFHKGDIFAIREDGFAWGRGEQPPHFQIIKLPGTPVDYQLRQCVGSWQNGDGEQYRASAWRWNFEAHCIERKSDKLRKRF